jgi:hypothetical protein
MHQDRLLPLEGAEVLVRLNFGQEGYAGRCVDSIVPVYFAAQKVHGVDRHLVLGIQMFSTLAATSPNRATLRGSR